MEAIVGFLCVVVGIASLRLWRIGSALEDIAEELTRLQKGKTD